VAEAKEAHAARHYEEAIARWKDALSARPGHLNAGRGLARSLVAAGSTDKAGKLLRRLVRENPKATGPLRDLARLCLRNGEIDQALECTRAGLELAPSLVGMRLLHSQALVRENALEEAEQVLDRIIAEGKGGVAALSLRSNIAWKRRDYEEASQWLARVVKKDPSRYAARFRLARALIELRRLDEAESILEKLVEDRPKYPLAWLGLGLVAFRSGEFALAEKRYRTLLEIAPSHRLGRLTLARLFQMLQRTDEAEALFLESVDQESPGPAYLGLAKTAEFRGDYAVALDFWTKAREIMPERDQPYRGQARALIALHRFQEALEPIARVAELRPEGLSPWLLTQQALQEADEAGVRIELDAHFRLGRTQRVALSGAFLKDPHSDYSRASDRLLADRKRVSTPDDSRPSVVLVCSVHRMGDLDNALRQLQQQDYEPCEVMLVLHGLQLSTADVQMRWSSNKTLRVLHCPGAAYLGECLNLAIAESQGEIIFKFDADDLYMPNYTTDMAMALRLYGADVVAKCAFFVYLEQTDSLILNRGSLSYIEAPFVPHGTGSTICAHRSVFSAIHFQEEQPVGEDVSFYRRCMRKGLRIYYADPFNHIVIKKREKDLHTWKIFDEEVVDRDALLIGRRVDFQLAER
jgi:tetratricopeptide (TPR) repeat protein